MDAVFYAHGSVVAPIRAFRGGPTMKTRPQQSWGRAVIRDEPGALPSNAFER